MKNNISKEKEELRIKFRELMRRNGKYVVRLRSPQGIRNMEYGIMKKESKEKDIQLYKYTNIQVKKESKEKDIQLDKSKDIQVKKESKEKDINEKIIQLTEKFKPRKILLYKPLKDEVDISPVLEFVQKINIEIFLPKKINDHWGIIAVDSNKFYNQINEIPFEKNDICIIPGLAFDQRGYRLGRGGGTYDRYLKESSCLKIGMCFKFQLVEKLPNEDHDVRMDKIICE